MNDQTKKRIASLGFGAKGIVYVFIGALALVFAFGKGGKLSGSTGVIEYISGLPGATVLLIVLGIGLLAYSAYRFHAAIIDPDGDHIVKRLARFMGGLINLFLAVTCAHASGFLPGGSGASKKTYLDDVLNSSWGRWLAIAFGLAVIGSGLYQAYKAWKDSPAEEIKHELSSPAQNWIIGLGRFGLTARAVVFAVIGVFLVKAGLATNADEAKTTGGALAEISQQSYGTVLLVLVAGGLAAYGAYMLACARYQNFST